MTDPHRNVSDPLLTTLLDIAAALPGRELIIAGGYGLFLKQTQFAKGKVRTLFSESQLPGARTTEDIDWVLHAEVVTDSKMMGEIRKCLDSLAFEVVTKSKYMQFTREMRIGQVKVDLLAAPLGEFSKRVKKDDRRVRPKPSVKLHASKLEEAVAVERDALRIPIAGYLSSGRVHETEILVPQAFSFLLMKLNAFRDRLDDPKKDQGRHHALDIYRIVGLMTRDEFQAVKSLAKEFRNHPGVGEVRGIVDKHFTPADGLGRIRMQEHPLYAEDFAIDELIDVLSELFPPVVG